LTGAIRIHGAARAPCRFEKRLSLTPVQFKRWPVHGNRDFGTRGKIGPINRHRGIPLRLPSILLHCKTQIFGLGRRLTLSTIANIRI